MNTAYILLGSNMGDRMHHLRQAKKVLSETTSVLVNSSVYETEAWGVQEQASFYNCVLQLKTPLSAEDFLSLLLHTETVIGRVRKENERWRERIIDIDLLFFNADIIHLPQLIVPHPHIHTRRFTLVPLAEIAPHFVHPRLQKSIVQLLKECKDPLQATVLKDAL